MAAQQRGVEWMEGSRVGGQIAVSASIYTIIIRNSPTDVLDPARRTVQIRGQARRLAFADGEWTGIMSYIASHEFYFQRQTDAWFAGGFNLTALGGELDGTFEYEGGGVQQTAFGSEGWFTSISTGVIFGGAEAPVMSIELLDMVVNTVFDGQTFTTTAQVLPAIVGPMEHAIMAMHLNVCA